MASTNIGSENILSNGTCTGYFSSVQRLWAQWKRGPSQAGIPQSQLAWFITHPKGCFSVRFLLGTTPASKCLPVGPGGLQTILVFLVLTISAMSLSWDAWIPLFGY